KPEQRRDHRAQDQSEFLAGDGEDEIAMRFGDAIFDGARTRSDAGEAAMREGFQGKSGLVARTRRVEELVDTMMDMGKKSVSDAAEGGAASAKDRHPEQRHTGEEQQRPPQGEQERGLADIGLQQQDGDGGKDEQQ